MAETPSPSASNVDTLPRILAYLGSDDGYFEEWRRQLIAPGDPWTALRCADADGLVAAGPVAAAFVDVLSRPSGSENLRLTIRKADPDLPVVLLTGLSPSLEDEVGWGALDSIYRKDWIRLQSLTRWIHMLKKGTTSRQDRDELLRTRETLQTILGAVQSTITVLDRAGKMVYANFEAARVMGFPSVEALLETDPREVVGRFEILDEHDRPFPLEQLPSRLAFQRPGPVPPVLLQWRHRESRKIFWSWVNAVAIRDAGGAVDQVVNTSQDVTMLKRAERGLKESEERFRHLAEAALEGIALLREGRIAEVNAAFGGMFGMPAAFFKDLSPDRFFESDTLPLLRRALSGNGEESYEGRALTPGGGAFPVLLRGRKMHHDGKTIQVLAVRNLAAERRLEEETARLFQLSPDLLCVLGPDGRFSRLSPSWERMLGFPLDEIQGRPYSDFVHPEDLAASNREVEKLRDGRHSLHFENRYRCKDGSWRWIQWNGCLLPDGKSYLGIGRDVSAEKTRQWEFAETEKRNVERIRSTNSALLRVLRTARENLVEKSGTAGELDAWLRESEALLDWDAGASPFPTEEIDYGALLEGIISESAAETGGAKPALIWDAGAPRLLLANAGRMRNLFFRLLRFWNPGGRTHVSIRPPSREGEILWMEHRLENVGGAAPGKSPVANSLNAEIPSLLCAAWVLQWGGRVPVESPAGVFRFSLSFPVASPPASETAIFARPHALLVEDHPINQRLMLEMLERLGPYRVTVAVTGQDAVKAAAGGLDLVLMDCRLPGWDGYEATRRIRAEEAGTDRRVPIIALTADAMEATRARCLEAGMDDFLSKPVLMDDLAATLKRWTKR